MSKGISRKTLFLKNLTEVLLLDGAVISRRPSGHTVWTAPESAAELEILQGLIDDGHVMIDFDSTPEQSAASADVERILAADRTPKSGTRSAQQRLQHAHDIATGAERPPQTPRPPAPALGGLARSSHADIERLAGMAAEQRRKS